MDILVTFNYTVNYSYIDEGEEKKGTFPYSTRTPIADSNFDVNSYIVKEIRLATKREGVEIDSVKLERIDIF